MDASAFAALVEQHQPTVLALCLRMTGNRSDALDAAQQAFLQAYRHLDRYNPSLPFRPWVLRIAGNECIALLRRRSKEPVPLEPEALDLAGGSDPPDPSLLHADRERVRAAVARLPDQYRRIVVRYYYEDLTYAEIAECEGIPPGTVGTHLHRAKQMLRRLLGTEEGEAHDASQRRDPAAVSLR